MLSFYLVVKPQICYCIYSFQFWINRVAKFTVLWIACSPVIMDKKKRKKRKQTEKTTFLES